MKIKTDEITSVIKQEIEQFSSELEISQVGRVVEVGDGIARIYGLSQAMAGELVEFDTREGAVMGQVMNLELDTVGSVIYGNYLSVREGDTVKSTKRLLEVPCGDALLGRVIDPLGRPYTRAVDAEEPVGETPPQAPEAPEVSEASESPEVEAPAAPSEPASGASTDSREAGGESERSEHVVNKESTDENLPPC